jgi:hypothetical protein
MSNSYASRTARLGKYTINNLCTSSLSRIIGPKGDHGIQGVAGPQCSDGLSGIIEKLYLYDDVRNHSVTGSQPTYNVDDLPHQACESDNVDMFRPMTTTYEHSKTVNIFDTTINDQIFDVLIWIRVATRHPLYVYITQYIED